MIKTSVISLAIMMGIFSASAHAQQQLPSGYWVHGYKWKTSVTTSARGDYSRQDKIVLLYWLSEFGGKTRVCGSFYNGGFDNKTATEILASYILYANGKPLLRNFTFLEKVLQEDDLIGSYGCKTTSVSWRSNANDLVSEGRITGYVRRKLTGI